VGGWALDADWQVAQKLIELGDTERGLALLRSGIDNLEPAKPAPTDDIGGAYTSRILALCRSAESLFALDREKSDEALELAAKTIEEAGQFRGGGWTGWGQTRGPFLAALALKDPEGAYARAQADLEPGRRHIPIPMVLNMIRADPATVLKRLDEVSKSGVMYGEHFQGVHTVTGALAAAVFRENPKEGMELAVRCELDKTADVREWPPLEQLAKDIQKLGLQKLPLDAKYTKVYQRVVKDLARLDHEIAVQLAMCLGDPKAAGVALCNICEVLAGTDLAKAQEAALKMVELHDNVGKCSDDALGDAARALSYGDEDVVPALLERVRTGWKVSEPFGEWWKHHRAAAEMLLPELSEFKQFFAILGVLTEAKETLSPEEGRALCEQALGLPLFGKDERTTWWALKEAAGFAPDLAHEAWQKLEPLDTAEAKENDVRMRLDALLAIGQGLEEQEQGTSGAEVAEIEKLLEGTPRDARSGRLYRARLAHIYAYYDGALCKATAEEILAALRKPWGGAASVASWSEAVAALARVDREAGITVMLETVELWRTEDGFQTKLFPTTVSKVARWRPELLTEVGVATVGAEGAGSQGHWPSILVHMADEASREALATVLRAWLASAEDKAEAACTAVENLQHAHRPELIPLGLECVARLEDDSAVGQAIGRAGWTVALASDEQLQGILERVQAFGPDVNPDVRKSALQKVAAAMAARDWQGSQDLLASLDPEQPKPGAELALLILEMVARSS
jgi:hypothetical protein